jgi:hypothetical protein
MCRRGSAYVNPSHLSIFLVFGARPRAQVLAQVTGQDWAYKQTATSSSAGSGGVAAAVVNKTQSTLINAFASTCNYPAIYHSGCTSNDSMPWLTVRWPAGEIRACLPCQAPFSLS